VQCTIQRATLEVHCNTKFAKIGIIQFGPYVVAGLLPILAPRGLEVVDSSGFLFCPTNTNTRWSRLLLEQLRRHTFGVGIQIPQSVPSAAMYLLDHW